MIKQHEKTINFIVFLRALAALLVVCTHYFAGLTWSEHLSKVMAFQTFNSLKDDNLPHILRYFSAGTFAVNTFFLISGFAIFLALDRLTIKQFLIARFFRIYPTLLTALILYGITTYTYCYLTSTEIPAQGNIKALLASLTLFDDLSHFMQAQYHLLWTLQVEWKFYLISSLLVFVFRKNLGYQHLLCFTLLSYFICKIISLDLAHHGYDTDAPYFFRSMVPLDQSIAMSIITKMAIYKILYHTSYMFIGSIIYFHYKEKISNAQLTLSLILILSICLDLSVAGQLRNEQIAIAIPVIIFTLLYFNMIDDQDIKLSRPIKFLADISYPLYLLHPIGYHTTSFFINNLGVNHVLSFVINLIFILFISYLCHILVEKPLNDFGKKICKAK